jgi:hypothetical protein
VAVAALAGVDRLRAAGYDAAIRRRSSRCDEVGDELLDPDADVVADGPDHIDGLPGGVGELPVLVAFAGEDGAGVAAARGDDDVTGLGGVVVELLGLLGGDAGRRRSTSSRSTCASLRSDERPTSPRRTSGPSPPKIVCYGGAFEANACGRATANSDCWVCSWRRLGIGSDHDAHLSGS